jgi:hypothetical protein
VLLGTITVVNTILAGCGLVGRTHRADAPYERWSGQTRWARRSYHISTPSQDCTCLQFIGHASYMAELFDAAALWIIGSTIRGLPRGAMILANR